MQVSATNGGTMELVNSGVVWVHFAVMSNELNTPKYSLPADKRRADRQATLLEQLNTRIKYLSRTTIAPAISSEWMPFRRTDRCF